MHMYRSTHKKTDMKHSFSDSPTTFNLNESYFNEKSLSNYLANFFKSSLDQRYTFIGIFILSEKVYLWPVMGYLYTYIPAVKGIFVRTLFWSIITNKLGQQIRILKLKTKKKILSNMCVLLSV